MTIAFMFLPIFAGLSAALTFVAADLLSPAKKANAKARGADRKAAAVT